MEESSPYIDTSLGGTGVSNDSIKLDSSMIYYVILVVLLVLIYSAYSSFCSNQDYDSDDEENFIEKEVDKLRDMQEENLE